ncbi:hypothetical protein [Cerasicoccus arenae]|uniref:Uncharacterized protein n=1 Tax=Cerasicoccus arenae TaxID=424488 RepID=A0A8J3DI44_9BACT|nr:hypothetical protein [Cerasicoccus arenae]MBK1857520.1 hypothetical protein [Cerasicoccus arenae]GHB95481.1 hypothetical protein GCM10007047_09090 [Cerasicoccus arenae]
MIPTNLKNISVIGLLAITAATTEGAIIINFEEAPNGSITNVSPGAPYTNSGFVLTPINADAAVFGAGSGQVLIGDTSAWLGFASNNTFTLTYNSGSFDLISLEIGPSDLGSGTSDFSIVGFRPSMPNLTSDSLGLLTAQNLVLNWTGLSSVTITAFVSDGGIDDLVLIPNAAIIPEPSTYIAMTGFVILGVFLWARRTKANRAKEAKA